MTSTHFILQETTWAKLKAAEYVKTSMIWMDVIITTRIVHLGKFCTFPVQFGVVSITILYTNNMSSMEKQLDVLMSRPVHNLVI
jgi:hypothetical protein